MVARSLDFPVFAPAKLFSPGQVWTRIRTMFEARRTRLMLAELDHRMLADIGIGRGEALVEAARPMWDVKVRN